VEFSGVSVEGGRWERLPSVLQWLAQLGAVSADDEERALRKRVLNLATAMMVAVSPIWVATYLALGHELAAAIPLAWLLAASALLIGHGRFGFYRAFRLGALSMMLVFPFLLMWSLGGFANSSVVGLWALIAPLGATFFSGPRSAGRWFGGFVALVLISALLDPALSDSPPEIPAPVRTVFFGLNLAAVSATAFLLLQYFVRSRELEQARSERLLLNILPRTIASRLKRSDGVIADACPEATVLFADLVDFTPLTESTSAEELVRLLDRIFSTWDELALFYGLEKIKTIGDEYMVAGGIPDPRPDHAEAVGRMALRMQDELTAITISLDQPLRARIGIDTGPVIAGVIGRAKFSYDLWGETVNRASRMESGGVPGRIQITERMRNRLGEEFAVSRRGRIEAKGLGEVTSWFLEGTAHGD
jgi:adenylate cyclase